MAIRQIHPPWDYLHDASLPSLENYELSRLNHAANLRREMTVLLDQWVEETTQAMLARWVREDRVTPRTETLPPKEQSQPELPFLGLQADGDLPSKAERSMKISRRKIPCGLPPAQLSPEH